MTERYRADRFGVLLLNLGTPDSTSVPDVRRYLREFLSDPRVIDISPIGRWMLLNLIILPFRPKKSAEAYEKIWTDRGSPLMFHGQDLLEKVSTILGEEAQVEFAMRYQNPSVASVLKKFRDNGIDRIVVFPLFPQYSSAAWGSAVEKVYVEVNKCWNVPSVDVVPPFYDHPAFIDAFASVAQRGLEEARADLVLMSFHGLPERHVIKSENEPSACLQREDCCAQITPGNRNCYRAQCYATARLLAAKLGLRDDGYEVAFQSRLGRSPWIHPYTDIRVQELAAKGVKRLAVLEPSFVADCLETIEEIGIRAKEDFESRGGEELILIPSTNSDDAWAQAVVRMIREAWPFGESLAGSHRTMNEVALS